MHDGASGPQFAADALWRQAPLAQPLAGCTERQSGRAGGAQPTQMPGWGCQSARASQIARARPRKLAAPRDTIHKVRLYREGAPPEPADADPWPDRLWFVRAPTVSLTVPDVSVHVRESL